MVVLIQPCLEGSEISDSIATPGRLKLMEETTTEIDTAQDEGIRGSQFKLLWTMLRKIL